METNLIPVTKNPFSRKAQIWSYIYLDHIAVEIHNDNYPSLRRLIIFIPCMMHNLSFSLAPKTKIRKIITLKNDLFDSFI